MKKFKRLVAVLVCAMMMTGCGAGGSDKNSKNDKTTEIVEAAKTHLGIGEVSKDEMIKFYEEGGNGVGPFENKIGVQDEEIIKLRKGNSNVQNQTSEQEIILLHNRAEGGHCVITVVKFDKDGCQNDFEKYMAMDILYSDDKLIVFDAFKNHCSFAAKIDDERLISGQVNWSYVGETTEQSEYTKNLVAFFDAIGAPNPIAIVEQNADKVE